MQKESNYQILRKSELLKNTSILISGTALAQLIPILLQPVLRRYFSPEIFGSYSVYLSLIGILIIVSSFKYELAIILPRKDNEAANVFFLAVLLNVIFNLLLILVIIFWKSSLMQFLNLSEKFGDYLYFVPLGTCLFSFYQSLNFWLIRKKGFLPISINKFVRRGFEGVAQVGFKYAKVSHGLIFGDLIGNLANVCSGLFQSMKYGLSLRLFSPQMIKKVLVKYSEYPKFNVIPSFMSACSFLLPAILINKFFTSENTGFFDLSKLLLSIPLALVATSISNVMLQRVSEKYRNSERFLKELLPIFSIVIIICAIEIIVIEFFGVVLFKLIFGELWGFSGSISRILVWSYALNFIVASFSSVFISMNKIKLLSIWQLFYFISILSLFLFKNLTFIGFIKVYVMIEVLCYLVITAFMISILMKYEAKIKSLNLASTRTGK
jgi:O-antigen/teichoic acid export membrane protein